MAHGPDLAYHLFLYGHKLKTAFTFYMAEKTKKQNKL